MLPDDIFALNGALNAFVSVAPAQAPARAGPLQGWTVALKDNFDVAGEQVGVGATMFAKRRAAATATAVQRLLDAGALISGRAQMVEFAFGGWGINPALGTPRNPWDSRAFRVAGGSSSGSAVAVAARMTRVALGGDTAGSVRMPAALCGITGLKTSFGVIPEDGAFPLAPSYDTVGPMALSAEDCACLFEVLAQTRLPSTKSVARARMLRLDRAAYPVPVEPDVQQALDRAAAVFEHLEVSIRDSTPPFSVADLTRNAGTLIASEAWLVHRTAFERDPNVFGLEIRQRLDQARKADPHQVASARTARNEARHRFQQWLAPDEVLLLPTVHCSAPALDAIDEQSVPLGQFTRWVNHVGGCALSLPSGFDHRGLPLAIQLVGRAGTEGILLALGRAFQQETAWHLREPDLHWARAPG